jgi:vitamin B12 transporter
MKKNILTTTLITLGLASSWTVSAATDEQEHILVTANRSQQEQFLSLSANTIIDKTQIEMLQPQNITDLLDQVAGISVVQQGGAGQASSVFMRGTNSNHTLILVDGMRIGSATLGSTNFSAISVAQVERIEIVKGPRAALWGSDAIGGVIQIFTTKMTTGEGIVSVGVGSNGLIKADASIGLGNEEHSLTITVATEDADGFNAYQTDDGPYDINEPDADGYDRVSVSVVGQSQLNNAFSLHLASRLEQGSSEFDASYPDSPCWDDPSKACPTFYANEQEHDNYSARLAGQYQSGQIFAELSVATSQDQGESFGNGIEKSAADRITTERDQVSLLTEYTFSDETSFTAGFDWYNEAVSTNTDKDLWTPGFQAWAVDERDVSAFFMQLRHQMGPLSFEAAVRRDDVEKLDEETTYNASIGYQINRDWLVSINRATGFKAPTFNDLYWPGSGNAELAPENVTSNEILIRNRFESGSVELSIFDSEVENLIAWAPNEFGVWQPANVNQADIQGIELSANVEIGAFSNQFALAYVESEDGVTGEPLLRRPELTANYTLGYHWQDLTATGVISYRDESKDSSADPLPDYWLVDVSLSYQATDNIVVVGKVNNLFDEEYQSALNYVADGTNYQLSASYRF